MFIGKSLRTAILCLTFVALMVPFSTYAAVQETCQAQALEQPEIILNASSAESLEITVRFPENPVFERDGLAAFDEAIYAHPSDVGVPDLPLLRKDIELPFGADYAIEILDSQSHAVTLGEGGFPTTIPGRAPDVQKCEPSNVCDPRENEMRGTAQEVFPATPVALINTYVIRGHQIGQLQFAPVVYNPATQTAEVYQTITFRIRISEADFQLSAERSTAYASRTFEKYFGSNILNYNLGIQGDSNREMTNEAVLIIAPDAFLSTLSPLVALKESQGHPVTLVGLSRTGNTPEAIKSYIQSVYRNASLPPTYLILIGDVDNGANTMPTFIGASSQTVSDLYYGTVDGADWIPDIFVGRLPARNIAQLNTMIANLSAYHNLTGAEGWVKKASFLASNDTNYWQMAENTQDYVIQTHTVPAAYRGIFPSSPQAGGDKLYAHSFNAGNAAVVNAVNNRRALISYTGHGSRASWGAPSFSQTDIRNITSTGTFSVVTSFACSTGDFNATESFGETWLLQPNKGAIAFIGSSSSSFWTPDDVLERAMMDSLYGGTEKATVLGSVRFAGLMALERSRPGEGIAQSRYYWESYNLLGDPSLTILIDTKEPNFSLSASLASISVCQGGEQSTTINVGQINGFSAPVQLAVSALPTGVSAAFSVNPVNVSSASNLTFTADHSTSAGMYPLVLSGDAGALHHDYNLNLTVFDGSPQAVTLSSPAHQQNNVSPTLTFSWQESDIHHTYQIQVAKDSGFNQLVIDQSGLSQPSFTPTTPLVNSTTYYWRVRALTPCGSGAYSATFEFKTHAAPGSCPPGMSPIPLYQTDFEFTPAGWQHEGTNDTWMRNTARSHSPNNAFFSQSKQMVSLQHLTSPKITLPQTSGEAITLKFWQWFEMEAGSTTCFDGGILEISTNDGLSWSQVPNTLLLTAPYTNPISKIYGNLMGGKQAWCGAQDWSEVVVDLTEYAGESVRLRFTQGTDNNMGLEGWYVDDFSVSACKVTPAYQPQLNTSAIAISQAPGREAVLSFTLTNAGLNPDGYTLSLTENPWEVTIRSKETVYLTPGETTVLEVVVTVPADAQLGHTEQIHFSVVSLNDPHNPPAEDSVTIDLKAAGLSFMPFFSSP